jgi:hypothetical protein
MPSTLVMVAQYHEDDQKAVDDNKALKAYADDWSTQVYQNPGAVFTFNDYDVFINKIRTMPAVDKLAIVSHSGPGALILPHADPNNPSDIKLLKTIAADIGTQHQKINRLEFLGCNVGEDPVDVWDFLAATGIGTAIAHNYSSVSQPMNFEIEDATTEEALRNKLEFDSSSPGALYRYLLPGTDLTSKLASWKASIKKGGPRSRQLILEYFVSEFILARENGLFGMEPYQREKECHTRSIDPPGTPPGRQMGPTKVEVSTRSEAVDLKKKTAAVPLRDFYEVTVSP